MSQPTSPCVRWAFRQKVQLLRAKQCGSALLLVPTGFLILLILGALSVDAAVVYQARHEMDDKVAAAVNDLVVESVPIGTVPHGLQSGGALMPDEHYARQRATYRLIKDYGDNLRITSVDVTVRNDTLELVAHGTTRRIFGGGVPGVSRDVQLVARAVAQVQMR